MTSGRTLGTQRGFRTKFRQAFAENGAIDLASIMVGVIIVGVLAGVIAASVFAVIPWAQDNAAKQNLDAVQTAQSVTRAQDLKYLDLAELVAKGRLPGGDTLKVATNDSGSCYVAVSTSATGAKFWATNEQPQPRKYLEGDASDCTDIGALTDAPTANMVSTWDTSLPGCATIKLPLSDFNVTVNWGDGTTTTANGEGITDYDSSAIVGSTLDHTYTDAPGPHTIGIAGSFSGFVPGTSNLSVQTCLTEISRFRDTGTTDLSFAFAYTANLAAVQEIPDTVTRMERTFSYSKFNGDLSGWDVSNVTDMDNMFLGARLFNQPLSWDVSNVTDMDSMFAVAQKFDQDLSGWDVSNVINHAGFESYSSLTPDHLPRWVN